MYRVVITNKNLRTGNKTEEMYDFNNHECLDDFMAGVKRSVALITALDVFYTQDDTQAFEYEMRKDDLEIGFCIRYEYKEVA